MATTSRMLQLLSLLQVHRTWSGDELAGRLEISHRTVRRDVDRLRELGYRVRSVKGPDGGYRLEAGAELPPLLFDDEQALALAVALQAAGSIGAGIEEGAARALATVRQVLPARLRHRLDALQFSALPRAGRAPAQAVSPEVLLSISAAVRGRQVLRFDYTPAQEPPAGTGELPADRGPDGGPRRVEPHHLLNVAGRWYLLAWDLQRQDWRIFRADRMHPRSPAGPRFTPREVPGGDAGRFLAARFKGSAAADAWPCRGTVVLGLPATAVQPFAADGTVEDLGPARCRLDAGSWSWIALASSLGRFDAVIEEVSPPELAAAFGQLAQRFASASTGAGSGSGPASGGNG